MSRNRKKAPFTKSKGAVDLEMVEDARLHMRFAEELAKEVPTTENIAAAQARRRQWMILLRRYNDESQT